MNTQITTEYRPHVAVINGEIKTTSIVVAEHFGKIHRDVVRAVESIECSDDFRLRNFAQSSFEADMPNGGKRQHKMYEMTKDGFVFLAMGFTGKEAAKWKEAYINAFNAMAEQLMNQPSAPERKTKIALPGGLTLEQQDVIKQLVKDNAAMLPKEKQAGAIIKQWSAIKKKFGCSYKEVSPSEFSNIISLISRLPLEGELLEKAKPADNTIVINLDTGNTLRLSFQGHAEMHRYFVDVFQGNAWIKPIEHDGFVCTGAELAKFIGEPGMIQHKYLPAIIQAAAKRMESTMCR